VRGRDIVESKLDASCAAGFVRRRGPKKKRKRKRNKKKKKGKKRQGQ